MLAPPIFAQPFFYSQSLQNLYYSLPPSCRLDNPVTDTVVMCSEILQGVTVPVAYSVDNFGYTVHVGFRFLSDNIDTQFLNLVVVRFLEREALALLIADNLNQKLTTNRENGLTLLHNGNTPRQEFYRNRNGFSELLQWVTGMDISYEDGKRYRVNLNCGQDQKLTFLFEADAELLSDMDKKERDVRLAAQLSHHRAKNAAPSHVPACDNAYLQLFEDSVYVCQGQSFIIPQMNGNLYYLKNGDEPKLVFSLAYASETLSNVLLASAGHDYTVRITHRQYGGEVRRYELKSSDFYDYFSDDYNRYFGIETIDRDTLSGTLILTDRNVGIIHIAHVSVGLWDLLNGGIMEMKLDSNIPQHNIETLYGRTKARDDDNEKYKINIK